MPSGGVGVVACSSTHPVPNQGGEALRNIQRAHPSQASILERTPPCDLIPAQAVGQEGSCNTHFPCTRPEVWQPEFEVMH